MRPTRRNQFWVRSLTKAGRSHVRELTCVVQIASHMQQIAENHYPLKSCLKAYSAKIAKKKKAHYVIKVEYEKNAAKSNINFNTSIYKFTCKSM
jgi:menaquinone-dependent protoporphyrinogen IX oxidase